MGWLANALACERRSIQMDWRAGERAGPTGERVAGPRGGRSIRWPIASADGTVAGGLAMGLAKTFHHRMFFLFSVVIKTVVIKVSCA